MPIRTGVQIALAVCAVTISVTAFAAPPDLPKAFDAGWKGEKVCELLYQTESVRVGRCVFPPGVGHEKHYHNPHYGYVLEGGTMELTSDGGEIRIMDTVAGNGWTSEEITVHSIMNIGDSTSSYMIVEPRQARPGR